MKITIIGGGASGMTAAITAAQSGHEVTLLEHRDRIGKKILLTGNGRCNLSNERLAEDPERCYHGVSSTNSTEIIKSVFNKFGFRETMEFFHNLGIPTRSRNGLIYPYSDQASAVLDVLRFRLRDLRVTVITECGVKGIRAEKGFRVETDRGSFDSDRLILACGGCAQPGTGSDGSGFDLARKLGHTITDVMPGLVPLCGEGNFWKRISGVRVRARMTLLDGDVVVRTEEGELQLTDYGISGIAVMNLSDYRHLCKEPVICLDLLPDSDEEEVRKMLSDRTEYKKTSVMATAEELLIGILPKKLGAQMLSFAGININTPVIDIPEGKINLLSHRLKNWKVRITGDRGFAYAQISLGGVLTDEIKNTLESRLVPGVYFAGEILDLKGDCGGYNLQLAWSTGAVAGMLIR